MKGNKKTSLFIGSLMAVLIVFTPYLLYVYQSIPTGLENYNTSFFGIIKGGYYGTAQLYIHSFFTKFVPLLLLFIKSCSLLVKHNFEKSIRRTKN